MSPKFPFLYCSELCKQEADWVRYARAVTRDGRIGQRDVLEALQIKKALILSGGYPAKERSLTNEVRKTVFDRDFGRCCICGGPASQIDHHRIDSTAGPNDPINLRAICADCHRKKSLSGLQPITQESHPEQWRKAQELNDRVVALAPVRVCDDEKGWSKAWRGIAAERKRLVTR
jgi:hypothetical protein